MPSAAPLLRRACLQAFCIVATLSILRLPVRAQTEKASAAAAADPARFIQAARDFADLALEHGRDTYGPVKTPLFVDGIHAETHEPVMWRSRDGHAWALSDLGNQQNFFRMLAGLSALTGEPRYRQAAVDATRHALTHLMENGLLAWGGHMAYNASEDVTFFAEDKGRVLTAGRAGAQEFWCYALGWRVTGDAFLGEMARGIHSANAFEKGGHPAAVLGYLEMYRKTQDRAWLQAAERVGDHILSAIPQLKKGWVRFDRIEPLVLLHLAATLQGRPTAVPAYIGGTGFFAAAYGSLGHKYDDFLYR